MNEHYDPKRVVLRYLEAHGDYCDINELYEQIGHRPKISSTVLGMIARGELLTYPLDGKVYAARPVRFNTIEAALVKFNKMDSTNEVKQ